MRTKILQNTITICIACIFTQYGFTQVVWQKMSSPNEGITTLSTMAVGSVFAGTSTYGVMKTEDNGIHWINISSGLPDSTIRATGVVNPNMLFAGTGSHGIYAYDGTSWSDANQGLSETDRLAIEFAADSIGSFYLLVSSGKVFKWNGSMWNDISFNLPTLVKSIATGPDGTLYAGVFISGVHTYDGVSSWSLVGSSMTNNYVTRIHVTKSDTIIAVCNSNNVFRCHSAGGTWVGINTGLPTTNMTSIASDAQNRLFISTSSAYGAIYRSANNGASWHAVASTLKTTTFNQLAVSADGQIFAGASGVFRSEDHGNTWQDMNSGIDAARILLCFTCARNGNYYIGNKLGVWRSTDSGKTWQLRNTGLNHYNILQIMETYNGSLVLHGYNNTPKGALYRSVDFGDNWVQVAANGCDFYTKVKQHNRDTLWASSRFSGATTLSYSINDGASWNNNPLKISAIWDIDVSKENTMFVASESEGISRSDDGGGTFSLGVGNTTPWYGNVIEIERDENGVIFAAGDWWTHTAWFSAPEENGNTWTQFTDSDLTVHGAQDLVFDHNNNAYMACENDGVRMAYNTVWNAQTDWIQSSSGLGSPNSNVLELGFDTTGYIFAVTSAANGHNAGLYRSTVPVNLPQSHVYHFDGNGDWDNINNWKYNYKPSFPLDGSNLIIVDPPSQGVCIYQQILPLQEGTQLKIRPGKKMVIGSE